MRTRATASSSQASGSSSKPAACSQTQRSACSRPQLWPTVARQPTTTDYTPDAKDRGNSGGGTNTVHRSSTGDYLVTFAGLDTSNVLIHVSALGVAPLICVAGDHGFLDPDFVVEVLCVNLHGVVADSAFVVNILAQFHDFHGWDAHALWDDIKFSTVHCSKINRIALVGEKTWEKWMAKVCVPFTRAKIKYFDSSQLEEAKAWLAEPEAKA